MPKEELIVTTFVQGDSAGLLDFGVGIPLLCLLHPPPVFLSFRRAGFHLRIFEMSFPRFWSPDMVFDYVSLSEYLSGYCPGCLGCSESGWDAHLSRGRPLNLTKGIGNIGRPGSYCVSLCFFCYSFDIDIDFVLGHGQRKWNTGQPAY